MNYVIMPTCHWCHVMERESFEDLQVADYLNDKFVSIKVDKEERPDIDSIYMNVCQALTGSGGWPLTIIMTEEQKPFFAGTYFPKESMYGRMGLMELLAAITDKWRDDRESLQAAGQRITEATAGFFNREASDKMPDKASIERAYRDLKEDYDSQYGGFGHPPKFPTPHNLMFLLRYHYITGDRDALKMLEETLAHMYRGGIFDHIGYGFARYSTDSRWLVPHFEKMLYDNALLIMIYLEAWQLTQNPLFKDVAEKTLSYVKREMTLEAGGFYSAQDADVDGEEGKYYTFTPDEIAGILDKEESEKFCRYFDIKAKGNFEGKNIPNLIHNPSYFAGSSDINAMLPRVSKYRYERYKLHKDDKVLTSWNALMIAAHAKASRVLGNEEYLETASSSFAFVLNNMTEAAGRLLISWRDGTAKGKGLLDDYAYMAWASLELYEATLDDKYLSFSAQAINEILERFADSEGGFFLNPKDGEALIFRPKEQYDGAMPSGNSVAAYCLAKLYLLTGDARWQKEADRQLSFYYPAFSGQPRAYTFALMALMLRTYPTAEIVCLARDNKNAKELARKFGGRFMPQHSVVLKTDENAAALGEAAAFTKDYKLPEGRDEAYYLCQNQSCSPPVYDLESLLLNL